MNTSYIRYIALGLLLLCSIPVTAQAAWWNFLVKKAPTNIASTTATTTKQAVAQVPSGPTIDELNRRIAELEEKLQEAQSKLKEAHKTVSPAQEKPVVKTASVSSASSDKNIFALIRPALVSLQTATSTGTGILIDAQGHILTSAHTIWSQDGTGAVVGVAHRVTVTLANGTKKTATVVGMDQARDIAVLKLTEGGTYSFAKVNHDAALAEGDRVYVVGIDTGSVSGTITRKTALIVENTTSRKPSDTGSILVNDAGGIIGIPNPYSCKVIEEMKTCLTYTMTTNIVRQSLPKVLLGMKLYKERSVRSEVEELVKGQLEGIYRNTKNNSTLEYAVAIATGKNSFDYMNSRLGQDQDGKITKLYLNKLKATAEVMYSAMDYLKTQAYTLNIFFINESASLADLDSYERTILKQIETYNAAKLKEYQTKVTLWSAKKNEYDGHISNPEDVTHDYLMEQGLFVEGYTSYVTKEKKSILDTFSGEVIDLF